MEQTFVFLSGVGEAVLRAADGTDRRTWTCCPGDTLFVPTGWLHSVAAPGTDGCVYVTVNAFRPDADRVGTSAVEHAEIAARNFPVPAVGEVPPGPAALARCAEAGFRPTPRGLWLADFTALDTTLTADPATYRVRRVGPFEHAIPVEAVPRALTPQLADLLHRAAGGVPAYVEGSQSPLSCKPPCRDSDLDVLLAVRTPEDLPAAREAAAELLRLQPEVPVPLSPGIVHADWLTLPAFYSALSLDPHSPDRAWWSTGPEVCAGEAARRQRAGLALLENTTAVRAMLDRSLALTGQDGADVTDWRIVPRWQGYR
jgi:hypothetical protein